ncbi:hypothetical protein CC85DRAFT_287213 [Cutaneotrichosporon oleaginosum]|uniref:Metallo-beta-lactamase domain-containing protein n=1 Tax=Cutaneotrichosporon oleaginosum TaxID=879819 RepID=A0A0J1AZC8_9TREE|nr:uncharacterized protein CC85DRAFT_287213 [Cutaneotrichosporon oleaginosum]KLT40699.1 hypothetical protein CC85DRAFT_287213 [Cutaneotrichosporon oleaginosum]TXT14251.1 hypothetical protein COLE_00444 [Cutaneotrichosporon oleaginosum]
MSGVVENGGRCTPPTVATKKAPHPVSVHFLGTCSGGGPISSRQCSSLAVDFGNNIWLFDAADGTNNRLHQSALRMVNISRIFVTHMHADHVLGVVAIMAVIMSGVGQTEAGLARLRAAGTAKKADINIYGPVGLRELIRTTLRLTKVTLTGAYAVHELVPPGSAKGVGCAEPELHVNEAVGHDLLANDEGVWEMIVDERPQKGSKGWMVSAGPLVHRVPSIGYVLQEPAPRKPLDTAQLIPLLQANAKALAAQDPPVRHPLSLLGHLTSLPPPPPLTLPSGEVLHAPEPTGEPGRKLVIFGDCAGGTPNEALQRMCHDASLLVHECTNAAIPESVGKGDRGRAVRASGLEQSLEAKRSKEFDQAAKDRGVVREPWIYHGKHETASSAAKAVEAFADKRDAIRVKAVSRGHATPDEVGEFAYAINARRVAVNHFSAMFPSPRFATNEPFPALLGPTSPFPYPVPASQFAGVKAIPLNADELHLRMIMQSLVNQISAIWNGPSCHDHALQGPEPHLIKLAVAARDFMVLRVPSHELSESEVDAMRAAREDAVSVMKSWSCDGGAWVGEDHERRWVGVDPAPREVSRTDDTVPENVRLDGTG